MLNGSSRSLIESSPSLFLSLLLNKSFFPVNRFILVLTLANTYIRVILFHVLYVLLTHKKYFSRFHYEFWILCFSLDSSLSLIYRHVCKCILTSLYSAIITLFIYIYTIFRPPLSHRIYFFNVKNNGILIKMDDEFFFCWDLKFLNKLILIKRFDFFCLHKKRAIIRIYYLIHDVIFKRPQKVCNK